MCKSQTDGGQRCAAHTRPKYEAATFGTAEWDAAAAEYASTPSGELALAEEAITAQLGDNTEHAVALHTALNRGRTMRDMNSEIADAIRVETNQAAHDQQMQEWDRQSAEIAARHNLDDIPIEQWHERKMCIFDLETTDADPNEARMVTASILEIYGNPNNPDNIVIREWLVDPGMDIPEVTTEIHGITTAAAKAGGLSPATTARELNAFIAKEQANGVPIVAFNGTYDMTVLDRESDRNNLEPDERIKHDTLTMIDPLIIDRAAFPFASGGRKLVAVAKRHGVGEFDAHNSSADCIATAKVAHALALKKPDLQTDPKRLMGWQRQWDNQWAAKMTGFLRSKGETERTFEPQFARIKSADQITPQPAAVLV